LVYVYTMGVNRRALFVRVLELAGEMELLRLGTAGLDGTKIQANASRHSAESYEPPGRARNLHSEGTRIDRRRR
jgi:hypothetical protein